jgi:HAL2 family 3'(2'),5'-bisphosphate nucleotidase
VTVGDFASQALALALLHSYFPNDVYIAEEGSEALQCDDGLLDKVWKAVSSVQKGVIADEKQLMSAIDYGQGIDIENDLEQQQTVKRRVWCLDPIDGTKGFLRGRIEGGQYCIALALIEDGEPVLSVLGCPNLPAPYTPATTTIPYGLWSDEEVEESNSRQTMFSNSRGCLFVAVRGCGCYEIPLSVIEEYVLGNDTSKATAESSWTRLHVTPNDGSSKPQSEAKFCLGVERGFSDPKGTVLKIAQLIHGPDALTADSDGIQDIKNSLRMDGQGKYGLLARGDAECFLRLPKGGYVDWVWDVAAGYLVLKEAGGQMTDVHGRSIDFSEIGVERRAKLPDHVKGILGSCGGIFHEALVDAHRQVEQSEQQRGGSKLF